MWQNRKTQVYVDGYEKWVKIETYRNNWQLHGVLINFK